MNEVVLPISLLVWLSGYITYIHCYASKNIFDSHNLIFSIWRQIKLIYMGQEILWSFHYFFEMTVRLMFNIGRWRVNKVCHLSVRIDTIGYELKGSTFGFYC